MTSGIHRYTIHTMNEKDRNPLIRIHPDTRIKLKMLAAQHQQTMQDYVTWLVNQEIERQKKDGNHHEYPEHCTN